MSYGFYIFKMGEFKVSFFVMDIILLILFLGLINMIFDLHRVFLVLEFIFFLIIAFFTIISMIAVYNDARWGWIFLSWILGLILLDILFIYYKGGRPEFFFTVTIAALIGFLISVINIKKKEEFDAEVPEETEKVEVSKEFKPGKYVASKTGSKYHAPKCDWAKRIKKSNQVWFDSEKEAKKKGYKEDDCVKESVHKNF